MYVAKRVPAGRDFHAHLIDVAKVGGAATRGLEAYMETVRASVRASLNAMGFWTPGCDEQKLGAGVTG